MLTAVAVVSLLVSVARNNERVAEQNRKFVESRVPTDPAATHAHDE